MFEDERESGNIPEGDTDNKEYSDAEDSNAAVETNDIENNSNEDEDNYYNTGNYYSGTNNYNSDYSTNDYNSSEGDDRGPKKNKTAIIAASIVGIFLVLGIGITMIFATMYTIDNRDSMSDNSSNSSKVKDIGSTNVIEEDETGSSSNSASNGKVVITDVSSVVSDVMPSIVAITSTTLVENNYYDDFSWYFGGGSDGSNSQQFEQQGAGSGIVIDQTDSELLIITNNHVVEGTDSLSIQFVDGESVEGYIKGTDSDADIAIVAIPIKNIKEETLSKIKKATMGDSDSTIVGEGVIAIGNALGYGQSVTTGVISAKDREVTFDGNKSRKLIQTDAAINGGNSGGALIDSNGKLIGINMAKYSSDGSAATSSVEGMGFAIPISSVKDIISELETKETRTKVSEKERGYLGIRGDSVSAEAVQQYGMPQGVYVSEVTKGGGAEKAGIASTDVIVKFDGQSISSMESLQSAMEYYKAGEKVKVTIAYRDGRDYKEKEVKVTLSDYSSLSDGETKAQSGR